MALSEIDRQLLQRCLARKPRAWEDFVDRFMGLVIHVVNHSAQCRSLRLSPEDREDLAASVFLTVVKDDLAVLRHFRGESSLATYLTIIARRVVVAELLKQKAPSQLGAPVPVAAMAMAGGDSEERVGNREEVERLLSQLDGAEARVVRMYHLEGKSYQEISSAVGMPENSVGPTLSRARSKMRRAGESVQELAENREALSECVMDDGPLVVTPLRESYRCPGEGHDIARAVHLGRLAAFYPACRTCEFRHEAHALSSLQRRQWAEIGRRNTRSAWLSAEALQAGGPNQIDANVVRQWCAALGSVLWHSHHKPLPPSVLVACDGHWATAELVAAACDALQWGGCRALEAGASTTAALVATATLNACDAALWIGNLSGQTHGMGLKVWGAGGQPWSSPGSLDRVSVGFAQHVDRPRRRGGGLQRVPLTAEYLAPLVGMFHGLRPLRFVLATTCEPLVAQLQQLCARSACEIHRLSSQFHVAAGHEANFPDQLLTAISQQIVEQDAHLGLWISGDGETCQIVDHAGRVTSGETLFLTLARYLARHQPAAHLVFEGPASTRLAKCLAGLQMQVTHCEGTRESTFRAILACRAILAGSPDGRLWFPSQPPAADALLTVSLLLNLLSESDRPTAEVLDSSWSLG